MLLCQLQWKAKRAATLYNVISGHGQKFFAHMRKHGTEPPQLQIRVYAHVILFYGTLKRKATVY